MAVRRLVRLGATLVAMACAAPVHGARAGANPPADLGPLLRKVCDDGAVAPGGVAVVVRGGAVQAIGVFGRRVAGADDALRVDDPIPLGALSSPTTALVCALAVDSGSLHWTTTIGDVLGEDAASIDAGWRGATLAELASCRVAVVEDVTPARVVAAAGGPDVPAPRCREALLRVVGGTAPKTPHGTYDAQNRSGPCLAALLVERSARSPFEEISRRLLFDRLGLSSARFAGDPALADQSPAFGGHDGDGKAVVATAPDARMRALSPVTGLRLSLSDAARLLAALADPTSAASPVRVSDTNADPLRRPVDGAPAVCGWRAERRPWARGLAFFSGSRGQGWCSTAWVYPKRGYAIVVALNRSSDAAFLAAETFVEAVSSSDELSGG